MRRLSIAVDHQGVMSWRALPAVLLLTVALVPPGQADWPSFHNDARHTGFIPGSNYPVYEEVWWSNKTLANAKILASPVLKDNILITADLAGLVRALDAASGKELWQHKMSAGVESTPAISGDLVYVVDTKGVLKALNLRSGAMEYTATAGASRAPITYNQGKIFLGTEAGEVKAFLATDLSLLWTFSVSSVNKVLGAYNNKTDTYACTQPLSAAPIRGAPVVFDGKVYFGSMNFWVFAVNEQGTGDKKTTVEWVAETGDIVVSTAAINSRPNAAPRVIFTSYDGKAYGFAASPSGAGDNNCHGMIHQEDWTYEVPAVIIEGEAQISKIHSSPASAGDRIFFGANNGKVYAIDAANGQFIWETVAGGQIAPVQSSPAVANGKVVIGSADKKVYWINATEGKILKTFGAQSAVDTGPAIDGDRAFVAASDGTLYMFGPMIPRRADLQVTSIEAIDGLLHVTVRNAGDANMTADTTLRILVGGTFLANVAVPKLALGASTTVSSSTPVPGTGSVQVQAIVDPDNTIVESNDSNNELSQGISLDPPVPEETEEDGGGGGGFKIPAPGLVPVLALLGLAALAMRKRR